jgi:hypothetical protein
VRIHRDYLYLIYLGLMFLFEYIEIRYIFFARNKLESRIWSGHRSLGCFTLDTWHGWPTRIKRLRERSKINLERWITWNTAGWKGSGLSSTWGGMWGVSFRIWPRGGLAIPSGTRPGIPSCRTNINFLHNGQKLLTNTIVKFWYSTYKFS